LRKNKAEVIQLLKKNQIEFRDENEHCISFNSNVKLDDLLTPADYVIQDYASQKTGEFFDPHAKERWWDCCTASGGKSIMLLDKQPNIQLTVSDVRDSILKNLHHRFSMYNYQSKYVSHSIDLLQPVTQFPSNHFDQIICDVPCSGSGTWARSPEQYYYFTEEKLNEFHQKQLTISNEALQKLKSGGFFYYITCSVFKKENEAVVSTLLENNCSLVKSQLIKGISKGGDCLYIAVLKKD
jgi:16S rRNA (cytosine967-C5)-methyltransferase